MKRILAIAIVDLGIGGCAIDDNDQFGTVESEITLSGSTIPVYLRDLMVWNTHETGSPEIYVKCTTGSGRTTDKMWFDYINDTDAHVMDEKLVFTTGSAILYESEGYVSCKVMESDDTTSDDRIGDVTIAFAAIAESTQSTCAMKSEEDIAIFAVSRYAAPKSPYWPYSSMFCKSYDVAP